jgi:hypothetical protein
MNGTQPSLLRDAVGFVAGGFVAAIAAGLVFRIFWPPPSAPTSQVHYGEGMTLIVWMAFFCGAFVGRKGFNADFLSDLLPPIIGSYAVIGLMLLCSNLDGREIAGLLGFTTAGMLSSAIVSLLLLRWFPPKVPKYEG